MMWVASRSAFRAGEVTGTQWDIGNVGENSVAIGFNTIASGPEATAIGRTTQATAEGATAIGNETVASGIGAVALGFGSTASNTGTVALGGVATAGGLGSIAIGSYTNAVNQGSIVIGDYEDNIANILSSSADNEFTARARGGFRFLTSTGGQGAFLVPGGGDWSIVSDRNRKMNFRELDGEDVLSRLKRVPVTEWSYIAQGSSIRHIGPMAQDFFAAFGLGSDDVSITGSDLDGVSLAAVHALIERSDRLKEENAALRSEVTDLRSRLERLEALEKRLEALEKRVP
jgi:autotransporter adhesin